MLSHPTRVRGLKHYQCNPLQKLQGALVDLDYQKGIFASATGYSLPAKKYAVSSQTNTRQSQIDLYDIRPSVKEDEEGRVKEIHVTFTLVIPDYDNAQFIPRFSDEGYNRFEEKGLMGQKISFNFDTFYNADGTENCPLYEFSRDIQPIHIHIEDKFARGSWLLHGKYLKYDDSLYELNGIEYKIPYYSINNEFIIKSNQMVNQSC